MDMQLLKDDMKVSIFNYQWNENEDEIAFQPILMITKTLLENKRFWSVCEVDGKLEHWWWHCKTMWL